MPKVSLGETTWVGRIRIGIRSGWANWHTHKYAQRHTHAPRHVGCVCVCAYVCVCACVCVCVWSSPSQYRRMSNWAVLEVLVSFFSVISDNNSCGDFTSFGFMVHEGGSWVWAWNVDTSFKTPTITFPVAYTLQGWVIIKSRRTSVAATRRSSVLGTSDRCGHWQDILNLIFVRWLVYCEPWLNTCFTATSCKWLFLWYGCYSLCIWLQQTTCIWLQ